MPSRSGFLVVCACSSSCFFAVLCSLFVLVFVLSLPTFASAINLSNFFWAECIGCKYNRLIWILNKRSNIGGSGFTAIKIVTTYNYVWQRNNNKSGSQMFTLHPTSLHIHAHKITPCCTVKNKRTNVSSKEHTNIQPISNSPITQLTESKDHAKHVIENAIFFFNINN